jgi:hypothetical protein
MTGEQYDEKNVEEIFQDQICGTILEFASKD